MGKFFALKKSNSFIDPESWICLWCIMQIKLFIPGTAASYTCHPQPLRRGLIKTLSVGSFPSREVMRGWAGYFFVCVLREPLFILKHVLQGSSAALIVWSERALLSPGSDIMRVSSVRTISSGLLETTRAWNSTTNSADSFCTHAPARASEGWQGGWAVRRVGMLGWLGNVFSCVTDTSVGK